MVNQIVVANGAILKVIFENDYLSEEIVGLSDICSDVGVASVKTSTGYGFVKQSNGMCAYKEATMDHLQLMKEHCSNGVQIKAAGGIRTWGDLLRVRALRVSRVGATATEARRSGGGLRTSLLRLKFRRQKQLMSITRSFQMILHDQHPFDLEYPSTMICPTSHDIPHWPPILTHRIPGVFDLPARSIQPSLQHPWPNPLPQRRRIIRFVLRPRMCKM
jgi:hypothetical protein